MKIKLINVSGKEDGVEEVKLDNISVGDLLKRLDIDVFGVMVTKNGKVVTEHNMVTNSDNVTISGMGCC